MSSMDKLVVGYMKEKGVTTARELSDVLGIPIDTARSWIKRARARGSIEPVQLAKGGSIEPAQSDHVVQSNQFNQPVLARAQAIPEVKSNITSSSSESPASGKPIADDLEVIADRLHAAGGRALNRTLGAFEAIADPLTWIDAGCDLEKDIIPTIREVSNRKPANSIGGWHYFTKAVLERRERRLGIMNAAKPAPRGQDVDLAEADRKLKEAGIDPALCF